MEPGRAGGASLASWEAAHLRLGARIAPGEGRAKSPGTRDSSPAGRRARPRPPPRARTVGIKGRGAGI
eukprot:1881418-Prymnesium_polylepis.1